MNWLKLNKNTYTYIGTLIVFAVSAYIFLLINFNISSINMLIFWSLLSIIVESLLVLLPNNNVGVSVGYAVNLASIIVGGPLLGTTASFIGLLFRFPNIPERGLCSPI